MLDLKNFAIPDETRTAIVGSLMSTGVSRPAASEVVDLAIHAAEQALAQLLAVPERGSRPGVQLAALEIGAQLAAAHCNRIFQAMRKVSQSEGLATASTRVAV